jgi:hypothetical protein
MPAMISGSNTGTVFEVLKPTQILLEINCRANALTQAKQEVLFENLGTNKSFKIAGSEIGFSVQELIVTSFTLFLEPGVYRWSQSVLYPDNIPPQYLLTDRDLPKVFDDFGTGGAGSAIEIINTGTNNIYTHTSSKPGRKVYSTGKADYELLTGEDLRLEVIVTNTNTGKTFTSGETYMKGPDSDKDMRTGVVPFITEGNTIYKVEFKIQHNGTIKPKCALIQHG